MKFLLLFIIAFIPVIITAQITKKEADELVLEYIKKDSIPTNCCIYTKNNKIPNNFSIETFENTIISPKFASYVYFIDETPYAFWSHDCRFLFINVQNGKIITKKAKYPPEYIENWVITKDLPELAEEELFDFRKNNYKTQKIKNPENCYAVIISGGMRWDTNHESFWNTCSAMYKTLLEIYGYYEDNIYVLISDGLSWQIDAITSGNIPISSPHDLDDDGDDDIIGAAKKDNIIDVFNTLSDILDEDDYLFVYTTDHGGVGFINLWHEKMYDNEFADALSVVNAGYISILLDMCYSGSFISSLSNQNRVIVTSSAADEESYHGSKYTKFGGYWLYAVIGETFDETPVDADYNNDGYISMREAYKYTTYQNYNNNYFNTVTPQYNSTKNCLGEHITMGGLEICERLIKNVTYSSEVTISECEIKAQNVTVESTANVEFKTKGRITLLPGFTVENGGKFYASANSNYNPDYSCPSYPVDKSKSNIFFSDNYIKSTPKFEPEIKINNLNFNIYPNPTCGIINILSNEIITKIIIYNATGKQIFQSLLSNHNTVVDLSNQNKGIYLIRIITKNGSKTEKLIIQ